MKKLLTLVLIFAVLPASLSSLRSGVGFAGGFVKGLKKDSFTYLIAGFDDAADNTDAIVIVNYSAGDNTVSFLQIPRDTYFRTGHGTNRINNVYSSIVFGGGTPEYAMNELKNSLSDALGIEIDGYAGYNIDAFKRILSYIGDIEVDIPCDIVYTSDDGEKKTLFKKGKQILGSDALMELIRFRGGYAMGDLGRVDAQKFFISALAKKLKSEFSFKLAMKLLAGGTEGIVTDISAADVFALAIKKKAGLSSIKTLYATLPGSSAQDGALGWYYAVNKPAAVMLMEAIGIVRSGEFDPSMKFLNNKNSDFLNIYYKQNYKWRVYDDNTLTDIDIKTS